MHFRASSLVHLLGSLALPWWVQSFSSIFHFLLFLWQNLHPSSRRTPGEAAQPPSATVKMETNPLTPPAAILALRAEKDGEKKNGRGYKREREKNGEEGGVTFEAAGTWPELFTLSFLSVFLIFSIFHSKPEKTRWSMLGTLASADLPALPK